MITLTERFKELGMQASYHYADDTCKEWGAGDKAKHQALKIFDDNPALQPELRKIAADFLWTLEIDRPTRLPQARN